MKATYVFDVPGIPKGQGRPRFARMGRFVRAYDPKQSKDFKSRVAMFASYAGVKPIAGPVSLIVWACLPRPQRLMRRQDPQGTVTATCKPDADNVLKGVSDALIGIAFADDSQVADARVIKLYHGKLEVPHTVVQVCSLEG